MIIGVRTGTGFICDHVILPSVMSVHRIVEHTVGNLLMCITVLAVCVRVWHICE